MVTVAVIGGTGNVGKTIVDAFLADGKHEVIVITRKVRLNPILLSST
jgi:predicted dinucleotide-binding enzyme